MNRITVEIPGHQAGAVRRGLLASREAFAEEEALMRADGSRDTGGTGEGLGLERQLQEVELLLAQLPEAGGDRTVTGAPEPLRIAVCDALVVELEQLNSDAHDYWGGERTLEQLGGQLDAVGEYVQLLERIEGEPQTAG